jgi:hypothetical protein
MRTACRRTQLGVPTATRRTTLMEFFTVETPRGQGSNPGGNPLTFIETPP